MDKSFIVFCADCKQNRLIFEYARAASDVEAVQMVRQWYEGWLTVSVLGAYTEEDLHDKLTDAEVNGEVFTRDSVPASYRATWML